MAKRGRPRKRDGLTRPDPSTRASIVGSEVARSEKILPDGEVHDSSDTRAEIQSTPEDLGIVWADEEDVRIENEIAVELVRGAPYRNAVQYGLEEKGANPELGSNPMADNRDVSKGEKLSRRSRRDEEIVISMEEVSREMELWSTALIGYVIGDRVPFSAMEGFVRAQWNCVEQPEILMHDKGYYVFRFKSREDKERIAGAQWFFRARPIVLKDWCPNFSFDNESFDLLPTWIQLPNLDLMYWGSSTLDLLASKVGSPVCTDHLTATRGRISYPRILVEVDTSRELVESFTFVDPEGQLVLQKVVYEWMPIRCSKCNGWGHREYQCLRKEREILEWRPKKIHVFEIGVHGQEIKFEPTVMCEPVDRKMTFRGSQVVHFRSLARPKEDDFCLELSKLHTYDDVVEKLARKLDLDDPAKIRLTPHNCYSQRPKPRPIKYRGVDHLTDMLIDYNQTSDILYYEVLDIPLPELQGLKPLKVAFHHATKDEVTIHTIRLPKQSTVGDVLTDLKTKVELSHPNAELRLLEVFYHKIFKSFPHHEKIENINDQYWTIRAEEIPEEEKNLGPHDRLVHVYHFTKEVAQNQTQIQNFGEPFFLVIHEGETLAEVKARVQKKLQVPDDEFSKWKFAFLSLGRPEYLQDSDVVSSRFQRRDVYGAWEQYLGLEHSDNAPRRTYAANQNRHMFEKPVKIYN